MASHKDSPKKPALLKVHIGSRVFEVAEMFDGSMPDNLGEVLFSLGKINLAPNQTEDCLADTLFHEVIHAVDYIFGSPGTYLTEEQVIRITGGILMVLHDPRNAEFVNRFLLSKYDRKLMKKERRA